DFATLVGFVFPITGYLALRMVDPKQKFTTAHRRQLSQEIMGSNLAAKHLEKTVISEAVDELSTDADSGFDPEKFETPKSVLTDHPPADEKKAANKEKYED
ncbi:MAG: hypothetical protein L0K00_04120, partial [Corynebacterium casei]|nr:hypothetical protein [Corynebacterium casei]MDN6371287.1 hypothetical protein [Corynebacterium casei]MDN6445346.1 hypothetical protein [Corynebacterium casei]MDN6495471.1 hypothetical protein [Corynebacterium casei]